MTRRDPVKWDESMSEDRLWVCPHCDAELDADSVSVECPACGVKLEDPEGSPEAWR